MRFFQVSCFGQAFPLFKYIVKFLLTLMCKKVFLKQALGGFLVFCVCGFFFPFGSVGVFCLLDLLSFTGGYRIFGTIVTEKEGHLR